jgi:lipopolysaccharide exporter
MTDTTKTFLGSKVLTGSILQFSSRFLFRGLKFVRTIVVAKLLFPEDVGLFAVATLCLGFVDTFIQPGFQSALVQRSEITKEHLNGVWTLNVVRGVVLGLAFFLLAPFIADFFDEPRLVLVIQVLSLIKVFDGFSNIGTVLFQRDLEFGKKFLYELSYNLAEIITVCVAVIFIPNVWALVFGTLAYYLAVLMLSYVFHSYRPRLTFDFTAVRELFQFGKWLWLGSLLTFFVSSGDYFFVGKFIGAEELGYYQLAFSLALLPAYEIARSLSGVFFPLFSRLKESRDRLIDVFSRISRVMLLVIFPTSIGLYVLADPIVRLLYGERWLPIIPLLGPLIVYGVVKTIEYLLTPILLGAGHSKITTLSIGVQGIVMLSTMLPLIHMYGIMGVPYSLLLSVILAVSTMGIVFLRTFHVRLETIVSIGMVPVLAALGLCFALYEWMNIVPYHGVIASISMSVYAILVYGMLVYISDRLLGKHVYESVIWMRGNAFRRNNHE